MQSFFKTIHFSLKLCNGAFMVLIACHHSLLVRESFLKFKIRLRQEINILLCKRIHLSYITS